MHEHFSFVTVSLPLGYIVRVDARDGMLGPVAVLS